MNNSITGAFDKLYKNLWYTHRVHEKEAWLLTCRMAILRVLNVVLISVVLLLQFAQLLFTDNIWITYWSIGLTVAEVGFAFYQLSFNYDRLLEQHRTTAKKLVTLKNRMILLQATPYTHTDLSGIASELNDAYESAPQTSLIASKLANVDWKREYPKTSKQKK